jgi:hypothetical protein
MTTLGVIVFNLAPHHRSTALSLVYFMALIVDDHRFLKLMQVVCSVGLSAQQNLI